MSERLWDYNQLTLPVMEWHKGFFPAPSESFDRLCYNWREFTILFQAFESESASIYIDGDGDGEILV